MGLANMGPPGLYKTLLKPWDYKATFDRTFSDVPLLPGENRVSLLAASPGSGHQGFVTWRFNIIAPEGVAPTVQLEDKPLAKSTGGDFNPFTIQYQGPDALVPHLEFLFGNGESRKVTRGPNGNHYLAAKDTDWSDGRIAILQQRVAAFRAEQSG